MYKINVSHNMDPHWVKYTLDSIYTYICIYTILYSIHYTHNIIYVPQSCTQDNYNKQYMYIYYVYKQKMYLYIHGKCLSKKAQTEGILII